MISLIIPVYNEENSIREVVKNCYDVLQKKVGDGNFEILVVDDGSTDSSRQIIRECTNEAVFPLEHAVRRGVGSARLTGVRKARGEKILFIDADTTYETNDLGPIIDGLQTADMVIGARRQEEGTLPVLRFCVKLFFRKLAEWLTQSRIPDLNSGLRGMDREKTKQFLYLLPKGHSWVSTITLCFLAEGYTVAYVPTEYSKRRGSSKFNVLKDSYAMFMTIVKTVVYFYPLRVIMPFSFAFAGCGMLFLLRDLVRRNIADTTILMVVMAVLMFVFALLSEQLACLRREINQRIEL